MSHYQLGSYLQLQQDQDDRKCPACGADFPTVRGKNVHLSRAESCKWYKKGKLADLAHNYHPVTEDLEDDPPDTGGFDLDSPLVWDDGYDDEEVEGFEPVHIVASSSQTQVQDLDRCTKRARIDESPFIHDIHPNAGTVTGHQQTAQERWAAQHVNPNSPPINIFDPFTSELDWRTAKWFLEDGSSKSASDRLLQIDGFAKQLGLSFHNMDSLYKKMEKLPGMAPWQERTIRLADDPDEEHLIQYRNPIQAIKNLWSNPAHAKHMVYAPEKMWANADRDSRLYNEMWTGNWWWTLQELLPSGATVAPLIISTDKTQLTNFCGSKQAYPVYLTIGNIPRWIRKKPSKKACVLLAYLSTDKITSSQLSEDEKRRKTHQLFHESMRHILEPLEKAGREGVDMVGGDGDIRRVFPILACYPADYPEQCLVTCVKSGGCPKCYRVRGNIGDPGISELRTAQKTLDIIEYALTHPRRAFHTVCQDPEHGLNGHVFNPFWANLPYTNIHISITPDVLHQLHGGVFKHILEWCQLALGKKELDQRIKSLPPAHGIRQFPKGFSTLINVSGPERKQMMKILLGAIANAVPKDVVIATRAILDFTYIAQYPSHSEETLQYLEDALQLFHDHKLIFVELGIRNNFEIPKLSGLPHYKSSIESFGATDNYNTEQFERLHIDFAKQAFRASNRKEERPQMLRWLDRQEKVAAFQLLLDIRHPPVHKLSNLLSTRQGQPILLAKTAPFPNKSVDAVAIEHKAPWFIWYLKEYLHGKNLIRTHSGARGRLAIQDAPLPFTSINVWTSVRLRHKDIQGLDKDKQIMDSFHAAPERSDKWGKPVAARFDTVLVEEGTDEQEGGDNTSVDGTRVGRVKVIFSLPKVFTDAAPHAPKEHLAFVEWFTRPRAEPDTASKLYEVRKQKEIGTGELTASSKLWT
ncbi:hypothetical protein DFH11DRAFT_1555464 [Phellopilus nigrolimitatus]|nr:hypothetical protein DFH11DRAFT_1555464 [Phellopilus nigrolimitatus]